MISKWWQKKWDWREGAVETKLAKVSQRDFEIEFFERVLKREPYYWEVLAVLGNHYTAVKRYREGLAIDERLAVLRPDDPVTYYNLACSYSLVGRITLALKALERSLALGYRDFRHMVHDRDLEAVRGDERFKSLLTRYIKA